MIWRRTQSRPGENFTANDHPGAARNNRWRRGAPVDPGGRENRDLMGRLAAELAPQPGSKP